MGLVVHIHIVRPAGLDFILFRLGVVIRGPRSVVVELYDPYRLISGIWGRERLDFCAYMAQVWAVGRPVSRRK